MFQKAIEESELEDIGKTLVKFRSIREQNNINMTGKPWLDGIIWGRGLPLSLSKIRLNITYLPAPMMEKILNELDNQYEFKIVNLPSAHNTEIDDIVPADRISAETVFLEISSKDPIFRNLPRTRKERKVSIENDVKFLEGYLQSIMHSLSKNDLRIYPVQTTKDDIVKVLEFLQIDFNENPTLYYIKDPMNNDNPVIMKYLAFIEEESNYLKSEEMFQDQTERIKESIFFTEKRLKKKQKILNKRKLQERSNDELLKIIFDKSNRSKRTALDELKYRNEFHVHISEAIRTIYQENISHKKTFSIHRRIETEIIGVLFEWKELEILNDLQDKFLHNVNKDLAYKYVKLLRKN